MSTIYEKNGIRKVVNACGRMTALGVSTIHDEVGNTMTEAARNYVVMDELIDRAGELISEYTGGEDTCVTLCAAAGIMISAAACIAKDNIAHIEMIPDSDGLANEIIIPKGHAVNFNASIVQMLRMGGGKVVEAGQVNKVTKDHIRAYITKQTAALFYCKSHHSVQKGMVSIEDMGRIAHEFGLPLIVDAAAEEDLRLFLSKGADLVIYSGAKAIEGPTSGFITGDKELIRCCKKQYKGVGRVAKVGKEGIMGILKAIEIYSKRDEAANVRRQLAIVNEVMEGVKDLDYISASIAKDDAGREIYRVKLKIIPGKSPLTAEEIVLRLREGNPAVYTRDHYANAGLIYIDPRPMLEGDAQIIIDRLKKLGRGEDEV